MRRLAGLFTATLLCAGASSALAETSSDCTALLQLLDRSRDKPDSVKSIERALAAKKCGVAGPDAEAAEPGQPPGPGDNRPPSGYVGPPPDATPETPAEVTTDPTTEEFRARLAQAEANLAAAKEERAQAEETIRRLSDENEETARRLGAAETELARLREDGDEWREGFREAARMLRDSVAPTFDEAVASLAAPPCTPPQLSASDAPPLRLTIAGAVASGEDRARLLQLAVPAGLRIEDRLAVDAAAARCLVDIGGYAVEKDAAGKLEAAGKQAALQALDDQAAGVPDIARCSEIGALIEAAPDLEPYRAAVRRDRRGAWARDEDGFLCACIWGEPAYTALLQPMSSAEYLLLLTVDAEAD
jgi:hypothetical protein